jgi:hypothetical protein
MRIKQSDIVLRTLSCTIPLLLLTINFPQFTLMFLVILVTQRASLRHLPDVLWSSVIIWKVNVLLTVHHSISVQWNQRDALSFNLLRIKGLYMFRTSLAHPQEALLKQHLVYCVRIMSVSFGMVATLPQPTDIICTQHTKCHLCSASWGWASNARNM